MNEPRKKPRKNLDPISRFVPEPVLLEEIVADFTQRLRDGEFPSIAEYQAYHPELADELHDLLSSVAMIEQLKDKTPTASTNSKRFLEFSKLSEIGHYTIVREIGRGGMGIVFEAVHESLGRRVAVKVMPTPVLNGDQHVERFRREAQSAAKLHHTNIVSVFGVGEGDGFHYYVMDFVDGESLSEVVWGLKRGTAQDSTLRNDETRLLNDKERDRNTQFPTTGDRELQGSTNINEDNKNKVGREDNNPTTSQDSQEQDLRHDDTAMTRLVDHSHFQWAARIGAGIADALAYSHSSNILHRDIKPSNILLDRKGVVWITDFGLAKDSTHELNLTKTGDVIGTPQYLAPESLEGQYDHRSETYCLGLTLYELVTLQPAYSAGTTAEVIRAIATTSPTSPRKINRQIPRDLSTIIDKAVSRDPQSRYQTAEQLHSDLLAFVEDRPISARRPTFVENARRWSRRNPLAAMLSAVSALLLVLVAVSASVGYLATTRALNKEAEKSHRLTLQQAETQRARETAEDNFAQIKTQFDRAEANVALTMEAFDEMFKQVIARGAATHQEIDIDGFRDVAGIETSLTREDAAFLNKLLTYYEAFASLNAENDRLKTESAKALRRVGNIYQLVGEIKPAIAAYEKSVGLYETLWEADPDSHYLLTLAQTQNELSTANRKNGDGLSALQWHQATLELLEASPLSKTDPQVKLELARTLSALDFNLLRVSEVRTSGVQNRGPNDRSQRNIDSGPNSRPNAGANSGPNRGRFPDAPRGEESPSDVSRAAMVANRKRAGRAESLQSLRGRYERRQLNLIEQAIQILDELISKSPENAEYRSVRATCYCIMAAARIDRDREKSLPLRDTSITAFESLVENYPDVAEYRYLLALACGLSSTPPHPDDIRLLKRSIEITQGLLQQFPNLLDYHHLNATQNIKLVDYHLNENEPDSALINLKKVVGSVAALMESTPSDRSFRRTIAALNGQIQRLIKLYESQDQRSNAAEVKTLYRDLRNKIKPRS